jgi:hypothetical protein
LSVADHEVEHVRGPGSLEVTLDDVERGLADHPDPGPIARER